MNLRDHPRRIEYVLQDGLDHDHIERAGAEWKPVSVTDDGGSRTDVHVGLDCLHRVLPE